MAGRKVFSAGEVLQAADVNDFLMDQSVMVFAGTAARGSAIPSPTEGMVTYRSDDDVVEVFDGSVFAPVGVEPAILQVVSTTLTSVFSVSVVAGGLADVTGLTASITPSSTSSKVLISVSASGDSQDSSFAIVPTRGGSVIAGARGDASGSRGRVFSGNGDEAGSTQIGNSATINFLDSPSSTSSLTYGVQVFNVSSATRTIFVNRTQGDGDSAFVPRFASTITLMEVAG